MNLSRPKKIFIVDDDIMLAEAFRDYLTRQVPHQVSVFHTGEECLKHLPEGPEVIILDYFLNAYEKEAANGMEILQTIKHSYPGIHIIMLSGQESYNTALQSIKKGAEQYVIKDEDAFEKIATMINEIS